MLESVSVALWSVDSAGAVSGAGYNELSGKKGWMDQISLREQDWTIQYKLSPTLNPRSRLVLKASALLITLPELLTITAPMAKTSSPTIPVKGMR